MNDGDVTIGTCPSCGAVIHAREVIIEYRRGDEISVYADCPACRRVDHPNQYRNTERLESRL